MSVYIHTYTHIYTNIHIHIYICITLYKVFMTVSKMKSNLWKQKQLNTIPNSRDTVNIEESFPLDRSSTVLEGRSAAVGRGRARIRSAVALRASGSAEECGDILEAITRDLIWDQTKQSERRLDRRASLHAHGSADPRPQRRLTPSSKEVVSLRVPPPLVYLVRGWLEIVSGH